MTRLERFRNYVALMDPVAKPDAYLGLYVESDPRQEIVHEIAKSLELKPNRRVLMVGCTGSGKTTLVAKCVQRIRDAFNETGDYSEYVDVSRSHRLDTEDLEGVLIAIAGKSLARKIRRDLGAAARGNAAFIAAEDAIKKHAHGYTEWVNEDSVDPPDDWGAHAPDDDGSVPVRHRGVPVPPQNPMTLHRYGELVEPLRTLLELAVGDDAHAIFAFDSLDRLSNPKRFGEALRHDLPVLAAAGIGAIVVGPVRYALGFDQSIRELFDAVHVVPSVDVEADSGRDFLARVLRARNTQGMLSENVLPKVIGGSGGVLRDLISLAQRSGEEAYARGHETVADDDVATAISILGDALAFGIDDAALRILRTVDEKGTFVIRGEQELSLVDQRRILNLRLGAWRVHPALLPKVHAVPREAA